MWLAFAVLSKVGIKNVNSNLGTAIRTVIVFIFSWIMVFVVGAQNGVFTMGTKTPVFLILSGFATGASWLCYFRALKIGDVNKVAPIDKSSTILTMLLAFIFLREEITYLKTFCIVLIGLGTFLMIEKHGNSENKTEKSDWLIWALLSAVFASLTSILGKIGISDVNSTLGTAIRTFVVLIMAWIAVLVTKSGNGAENITKKDFVFLILSGITTGLSWLCYYKALQDGPASVVVPIDKLSILVTVIFSYAVLKEKLTKKSFTGLILLICGTLLLLV